MFCTESYFGEICGIEIVLDVINELITDACVCEKWCAVLIDVLTVGIFY